MFLKCVFFCLSFQVTFFVGGFYHCLVVATQLFCHFYADPEMKWSNSTSICFGWVVQIHHMFNVEKSHWNVILPKFHSSPLKNDNWKTSLSFLGPAEIFRGRTVKIPGSKCSIFCFSGRDTNPRDYRVSELMLDTFCMQDNGFCRLYYPLVVGLCQRLSFLDSVIFEGVLFCC